ncbi:hypothetical protein A6S26_05580 [Nostoc sp. ATCC 43529]|nr:hypothetical protein A6S26_05580 [Nostoc sp. ATCC 43529]
MKRYNRYIDEEALWQKRQQLRTECHQLIEKIFRHRYGIKLLLCAVATLSTIADYKANRVSRFETTNNKQEVRNKKSE